MNRYFAICLFVAFYSSLIAQVGLNVSYFMPQKQMLVDVGGTASGTEFNANGLAVGVNYWFRLKNKRVEFLPELNYSLSKNSLDAQNFDAKIQHFSFYFNTRIYFLNFAGDCDCPTFSKERPTLEKGLFLQISPGYSYVQQHYELDSETTDTNFSALSIGAGLGFDLGISDFVTITPFGGLRYFPSYQWNFPTSKESDVSEKTDLIAWNVGLHVGFRFDN